MLPALTYLASIGTFPRPPYKTIDHLIYKFGLVMRILALVTLGLPNDTFNDNFGAASTFLTISTNVLLTFLISFHLIRSRRTLAQLLPSQDLRLYTGVVAILIESALPLTFFGILYAAIMVYKPQRTMSQYIFIDVATNLSSFLFDAFVVSFSICCKSGAC